MKQHLLAGVGVILVSLTPWGVSGQPSISQASTPNYSPGGSLSVTNTFTYSGQLWSLLWRPHLPSGWTLSAASGDGNPELSSGEILWTGNLPASPIQMVYVINVPDSAAGLQQIRAEVEYQLSGTINPATQYASPDPLALTASGGPVVGTVQITHQTAANYVAGSSLNITNSFTFTNALLSLLWRPRLPTGCVLDSAAGDGNPELINGEILWTGTLPTSPIKLIYTVRIPAGTTGTAQLRGEVEYQLAGLANPLTGYASPDPLLVPESGATLVAPTILTPPQSQVVSIGTAVTFTVAASGSPPLKYQWLFNGANLAGETNTTLALPAAQAANSGDYTVVVSNAVGSATSPKATLQVGAALSNDNFANRTPLTGTRTNLHASNVGTTKEVGEPNHAGEAGGRSVWWSWTAPASGLATVATMGSSFDTVLAVYTGAVLSNLVPVASDDDSGGNGTSQLSFNAVAGTTYAIAVDGFAGAAGDIQLSLRLNQLPAVNLASPADGAVFTLPTEINLAASAVDPDGTIEKLEFYQGTALLTTLMQAPYLFSVTNLTPGHYAFLARAIDNEGAWATSKVATVDINWPLPANDAWANAVTLTGTAVNTSGSNRRATKEAGEPNHAGEPGGRSVWWRWQAPAAGVVTVSTRGSDFDTVLAVYTGSSVNSLTPVASDEDSGGSGTSQLTFTSTLGVVYQIAVDGFAGAAGNIALSLALNLPPSVSITAPTNGASFPAPAGITVNVKASDGDGQVSRVEVYEGVNLLYALANTPYTFLWTNVAKGDYQLLARATDNLGATATSAPVNIKVTGADAAPRIVQPALSQSVVLGQTALFQVGVEGTPPFQYQWAFQGTDIAGATNRIYVLPVVQLENAGDYTVVVRNAVGSATNPPATLTVLIPPVVTSLPQNLSVRAGTNVTLSVSVKGTQPMSFQWFLNGVESPGATNAVWPLNNVQLEQVGNYSVRVRNSAGEVLSLVAVLAVVAAPPGAEPPSVPREDFWITDGRVRAIVETNGVLYLGGDFNYVGPNLGSAADLDPLTGVADRTFPRVNGEVRVMAADGIGGWYLGGSFTMAGGLWRTNLVHVRADQSIDPQWTPNPDGAVRVLLLSQGVLYAGGQFAQVAGQSRANLAALDAGSGAIKAWEPDPDGAVNALLVLGNRLYIGGEFVNFAGDPRKRLAAVQLADGTLTEWRADASSSVFALAGTNGIVYAGGEFTQVGGKSRNRLAALDATTGGVTDWDPGADNAVRAMTFWGDQLYVGGFFGTLGGASRNFLGAVQASSGQVSAWQPVVNNSVWALLPATGAIYVGGDFTTMGGQLRNRLASLDPKTGQALDWNPNANDRVFALNLTPQSILAGGRFNSLGGQVRRHLAAIDAATGVATAWEPTADGPVHALALWDSVLFVGGEFAQVGGQASGHLAAVDLGTGQAQPWPAADDAVAALAVGDNSLFVGGLFTSLGGQSRERLGAVDLRTGQVTDWNPSADGTVQALVAGGGMVYAGGDFTSIGGAVRSRLAALDAKSGTLQNWDPEADGLVNALALQDNVTYAGGLFSHIGGAARMRLAALDVDLGAAKVWNPSVSNTNRIESAVAVLATAEGNIYVGGNFNQIQGQARNQLAGVHLANGQVLSWNPNTSGDVLALQVSGRAAYAGGDFDMVGGQVRPFFAAFVPAGAPIVLSQPRSQVAAVGGTNRLTVAVMGREPLWYQWLKDGQSIPGATNAVLILPQIHPADAGNYTVEVSNEMGVISSAAAVLKVQTPPSILTPPVDQTVVLGSTVDFRVQAAGTLPLSYQWQRNGANIPGETNAILRLRNVQATDAGRYGVVVANAVGAVSSKEVALSVQITSLATLQDFFTNRALLTGQAQGAVRGNNQAATREPKEPLHAGKSGGKSLWLSWRAPASGIATFKTTGSSFDTLLGIYTGTNVAQLTAIASDEDSGGYFTSLALFNAVAGTDYQIAIDGFGGATGDILLTWDLETTTEDVPEIRLQPQSMTRPLNAKVTVGVVAYSPRPLSYQWFHNNQPVSGATGASIVIGSLQTLDVGLYSVEVSNPTRSLRSVSAAVEIGPQNEAISEDKLEDVTKSGASAGVVVATVHKQQWASLSMGAIGTQILDNFGATKESGEPNHAGVRGGASRWFGLHIQTNATLVVDTIGSEIDTVMAVYTGTSFFNLNLEASDDNGAPDGIRSLVRLPVTPGDYMVAVDGVNGATGKIKLNWRLGTLPLISRSPANVAVREGASAAFIVEAGGNPLPNYQWRLNGVNLPGATNAILTLPRVAQSDAGRYSVVVENFAGAQVANAAELAVTPNRPPAADAQSLTTRANTPLNIHLTGSDPDSDPLSYAVLSPPQHGELTGAGPDLVYRPAANFSGTDGFTFKVNDGAADSRAMAVTITVLGGPTPTALQLAVLPRTGGQFVIQVQGPAGLTYTLRGSSNLVQWVTLQTTNAVNTPFAFADALRPVRQWFYQVVASPLAAPLRLSIAPRISGQFALQVEGVAGLTYTLQTSTNLLYWSDLSSTNVTVSPFVLTDPNPPVKQRFYRVRQP